MSDSPAPTVSSPPPVALTIAGSDSSGGAGIQADLRTFAFHCVHGASAITCLTAQNSVGVHRVDAIAPESVIAQIDAVTSDATVRSAKTGMLLNPEIIEAVASRLVSHPVASLVVDPVMVSRAGATLIEPRGINLMKRNLLPLATVLTPNRHEAEILSGMKISTVADMQESARRILDFGSKAVLIKGGGMKELARATDVWYDGSTMEVIDGERVDTPHTHGTGCTLSAAIAANLAMGNSAFLATFRAKEFVTEALRHSLAIGAGCGPTCHFFTLL